MIFPIHAGISPGKSAPGSFASEYGLLWAPTRLISTWRARARYRRELRRLRAAGPHLLPDIGLEAEQSNREMAKRFWED
ncbi:MAG: hypothetical protein ACREEP_18430 [Dongiaceae bacterium]